MVDEEISKGSHFPSRVKYTGVYAERFVGLAERIPAEASTRGSETHLYEVLAGKGGYILFFGTFVLCVGIYLRQRGQGEEQEGA